MFLPQSCQYKFVKISCLLVFFRRDFRGYTAVCLTTGRCSILDRRKSEKNRKEELQKKGRNCFVGISYMFLLSPGIGLTHRWKRTEGRNCAMGTPPFEMNCSWNAMTAKSSKDLLVYKPSCKQCLA